MKRRTSKQRLESFGRVLGAVASRLWGQTEVQVFRTSSTTNDTTEVPEGYRFVFDAHSHVVTSEGESGSQSGQQRFSLPTNLKAVLDPRQRLHVVIDEAGDVVAWGMSAFPVMEWNISETKTGICLPAHSAILTTFFVHPDHRRAGLYLVFLRSLLLLHSREGALSVWIWCDSVNVASARGIRRAGFVLIARHLQKRCLGLSWRTVLPMA